MLGSVSLNTYRQSSPTSFGNKKIPSLKADDMLNWLKREGMEISSEVEKMAKKDPDNFIATLHKSNIIRQENISNQNVNGFRLFIEEYWKKMLDEGKRLVIFEDGYGAISVKASSKPTQAKHSPVPYTPIASYKLR